MDNLDHLNRLHKHVRQNYENTLASKSKEALQLGIDKRIRTTMVGALSCFEKLFGYMWGHGEANPTPEQREIRKIWEIARNEILYKGNYQMKCMADELAKFKIILEGNKAKLPVKNLVEKKNERSI